MILFDMVVGDCAFSLAFLCEVIKILSYSKKKTILWVSSLSITISKN